MSSRCYFRQYGSCVKLLCVPGASKSHTKDALEMTVTQFNTLLQDHERFRGAQAYKFVHKDKKVDWGESLGLPKHLKQWLNEFAPINHGKLVTNQASRDGTRKYLVRVAIDKSVEAVLIPEADRATLCMSSQVGCSLQCRFCHTGTQKFEGNLSAGEILRQFYAIPADVRHLITNFVFMGQGEPLYNFKNLAKAVEIMTDPDGMGFGHGKITVSTSGIAPLIPKIASDLGVNLAVSLHSPNDALRTQIMPVNRTYPLNTLMRACEEFIEQASCATRRISFEYVMLQGINDGLKEALQLTKLVKHLPAHVNLIPFNPWPGSSFRCSSIETIKEFQEILQNRGIPTTIRKTRGVDIMAACGQLKSANTNKAVIDC